MLAKFKFLRLEIVQDGVLAGKLSDKNMKKKNYFCILKVTEERSWIWIH
jgi:hypothetical protein